MRQRVRVAILEGQHLGVVECLYGVAADLLAAGCRPFGLGFFLGGQGFLGAELGNDGLALVRALDIHAGVLEIAHGQAVERQARGEPDLLIVLALVDLQALADQRGAHRAHELAGVGLGGFFPLLDLGVGLQEGAGAVFVAAVHAQQFAPLHVVEQRGFFVSRGGRCLQPRQGGRNAVGLARSLHFGRQLVVALHVGTAGQGNAQYQRAPEPCVWQWPEFHGSPCSSLDERTRKRPVAPAPLQPWAADGWMPGQETPLSRAYPLRYAAVARAASLLAVGFLVLGIGSQ